MAAGHNGEFFSRLRETTHQVGNKLDPSIVLYYDIITRFSKPGATVWSWYTGGDQAARKYMGMACMVTGRHYVLFACKNTPATTLETVETDVHRARACNYKNFDSPRYSPQHADLLLMHLAGRLQGSCIEFANTMPYSTSEIALGEAKATSVVVKTHPYLSPVQEGLYAACNIKKGMSLCQYWGHVILMGARDTARYTFKMRELKEEPMCYETVMDCKARRINSFPDKPFTVAFVFKWTVGEGVKLMVEALCDIKPVNTHLFLIISA
jgi:hypothetical protein